MFRASPFRYVLIACVLAFVTTTMLAQTKTETKTPNDTTKTTGKTPPKKFRGRLPNNYGKIGLDVKQKESIYAIQARYVAELDELEKRIEMLKEERDKEIYDVLTEEQKAALKILLDKRKTGKKPAASDS